MNMILETGVCDEATQQPVENHQPANIAVRVGSTPGTISLVRPAGMVKRRYQVMPTRYQSDAAVNGEYDIVSPIGTTLAVVTERRTGEYIASALNYYDPEGECTL